MVRIYLVEGDEAELQRQLPIIRKRGGRGNMVAHFPGGGLDVFEELRAKNPDLVVHHEYNDHRVLRVSYFICSGVLKAYISMFACVTVIAVFQIVTQAVVTFGFFYGFYQVSATVAAMPIKLYRMLDASGLF